MLCFSPWQIVVPRGRDGDRPLNLRFNGTSIEAQAAGHSPFGRNPIFREAA